MTYTLLELAAMKVARSFMPKDKGLPTLYVGSILDRNRTVIFNGEPPTARCGRFLIVES